MIDNNYEKLENFDINLYIKKPYSYDKFVYGILISFGLINDIKGFSIINNIFDTYKQTYNQNVRQISIDNKKNNIDNDKKTSLKILLVDDIISNYKKTMELLNELDYYNIKQIDNINYNIITDSYDIIFLDIKMPSISVFNICKEIRNKISSHVAIVIITEFDMSVIEKSYLIDTNIDKYLIKPINIIELNTIMDNIKNIDNKKIRKSLSNLRYRINIDDISNNDKLHLSNHISRSSNSSSSSSPTSIFNYQNISNCQD